MCSKDSCASIVNFHEYQCSCSNSCAHLRYIPSLVLQYLIRRAAVLFSCTEGEAEIFLRQALGKLLLHLPPPHHLSHLQAQLSKREEEKWVTHTVSVVAKG